MPCANRLVIAPVVWILAASTFTAAQSPAAVHKQRYSMGTVFDIVVYHPSREDADVAVTKALDEIARLDGVMNDYEPDSDVSRLVREGRNKTVSVDPSLFDVIRQSIEVSRKSGGKFDITIGPMLKLRRKAQSEKRSPTAAEVAEAKRCVGYEKIELIEPASIRLRSDCVEIDLGGIGKGFAVDRAMSILKAAGIKHASINAGTSSIASIGTPPDGRGWPVRILTNKSGSRSVLLKDTSISTSQQTGSIVDPFTGSAMMDKMTVSVVAPSATTSDGLSTTLLLMSIEDATKVLDQYADVSALWISPGGEVKGAYHESRLEFVNER